MIKVAFFGEAMHELSLNNELCFGGDTYNSAVYLKRLLMNNAEVYFVSAIGSDELSKHAYNRFKNQGLKDRKSTRLNSSHPSRSRMPSSA